MAAHAHTRERQEEAARPSGAVAAAAKARWRQLCADPTLYRQGAGIEYRYVPERCVRARPSAKGEEAARQQKGQAQGQAQAQARTVLRVLRRIAGDAEQQLRRLRPDYQRAFSADPRQPHYASNNYTATLFSRVLQAALEQRQRRRAATSAGAEDDAAVTARILAPAQSFERSFFRGREGAEFDDVRAFCRTVLFKLVLHAVEIGSSKKLA